MMDRMDALMTIHDVEWLCEQARIDIKLANDGNWCATFEMQDMQRLGGIEVALKRMLMGIAQRRPEK